MSIITSIEGIDGGKYGVGGIGGGYGKIFDNLRDCSLNPQQLPQLQFSSNGLSQESSMKCSHVNPLQ